MFNDALFRQRQQQHLQQLTIEAAVAVAASQQQAGNSSSSSDVVLRNRHDSEGKRSRNKIRPSAKLGSASNIRPPFGRKHGGEGGDRNLLNLGLAAVRVAKK